MGSEEFVASVEELIAKHVSIDAAIRISEVTTGRIARDDNVERVVYLAIRGALEWGRKELAARSVGTMTFDEAMQKVKADKMVTRPGWPILDALRYWDIADDPGDHVVMYWTLDNLAGFPSGHGSPYSPSDEDRAATDWMEYQAPIDIWIDLRG